jgi:hypothetical protein
MLQACPEGLTTAEAGERLRRFGPNLPVVSARSSLLAKLGRRLAEPRIAILPIAAAISGATGDWQSFVIIVAKKRHSNRRIRLALVGAKQVSSCCAASSASLVEAAGGERAICCDRIPLHLHRHCESRKCHHNLSTGLVDHERQFQFKYGCSGGSRLEGKMSDSDLRRTILSQLEFDPSINAENIGVSVDKGVVTLTGHVLTFLERAKAEAIVSRIKGTSDDEIAKRAVASFKWSTAVPIDNILIVGRSTGCRSPSGTLIAHFDRCD